MGTVTGQTLQEWMEHDINQGNDANECIRFAKSLGYTDEDLEPLFDAALRRIKRHEFATSLLRSF